MQTFEPESAYPDVNDTYAEAQDVVQEPEDNPYEGRKYKDW